MEGSSSTSEFQSDLRSSNEERPLDEILSSLHINDDSQDEVETSEPVVETAFEPLQCLFCGQISFDLDENLEHMHKKHGLFIPDAENLVVDLQTLLGYLHLVISAYSECLYCGSQRRNPEAARQHMMGKGHCKIDIMDEESEFRDFYNFDAGGSEASNSGDDGETLKKGEKRPFVRPDDKTVRLESGRILAHRSHTKTHSVRRKFRDTHNALPEATPSEQGAASENEEPASTSTSQDLNPLKTPGALARSAKREAVFEKQLASLRAEDRRSLTHLTLPQQRVVLAKAKAQVERARKEENEMKLKIQLKANRAIKK